MICACQAVRTSTLPAVPGNPGASRSLSACLPSCRHVGVGASQRAGGGCGAPLCARGAGCRAAGGRLLWHAGGGAGEAMGMLHVPCLRACCWETVAPCDTAGCALPPRQFCLHGPFNRTNHSYFPLPSCPCPALHQMVLGITLLFTVLHILYVGSNNVYSGTTVAGRVSGMTDADVPLLMVCSSCWCLEGGTEEAAAAALCTALPACACR